MGFITNLTSEIPDTGGYINGQPSGIVNNGGTINVGSIQTGIISIITIAGYQPPPFTWSVGGIRPGTITASVPSGFPGATFINPNGEWGYNDPSNFVGPIISTGIAGLPFEGLDGGASNSANYDVNSCTHWTNSPYYKQAVESGWWSQYRGQFSFMNSDNDSTPSGGLWNISTSDVVAGCSDDAAATTTQDDPGQIVWMQGGAIPTQRSYGPRYNW